MSTKGGGRGFGRVRGWVGDWHLISGRMTAAASGSIRRPRGQCAGGSDPLSTPPRLFLHHLLLLSTYRPLCSEQSTPGRTELVCFVCRAKPFCSPPTTEGWNEIETGGEEGWERDGERVAPRERFLPLLNLTS